MDFESRDKELQQRYRKICGKSRLSKYESQEAEKKEKEEESVREKEKLTEELKIAKCDLAIMQKNLGGDKNTYMAESDDPCRDVPKECSSIFEFKFHKNHSSQYDKFCKEKNELEAQLDTKKKEMQQKQKKIFELQDKVGQMMQLETQLQEKTRRLEAFSKERDILERELIATRSELTGIKRTLELERQERRDLETRALCLIKDAKRKWENAEKDKIAQLNKHIESQTVRITELCTSNNEMSSRLQRTECELETTNAELHKLRVFQMQYKESLAKTRELSRQSVQGVETKLEEIATRSHNQLSELRAKLDLEIAKNTDLESKLRNEQDSNHCRQSRLNVALELAQNELKDCQEQLRSIQATLPARDTEIDALKKQLQERSKQLDNAIASEQMVATMQEQLEMSKLENEQLKQQLQVMKSDLSETMMNLEQSETLALNLEQAAQDKVTLQKRLQDSLEKEEEHLRKVGNLEELLRRLEKSVTKLEAENATLKMETTQPGPSTVPRRSIIKSDPHVDEQIRKLEQELQTMKEAVNAERQTTKQAQISLWKKEKELSDANLDKRIAMREGKKAEDRVKALQEEKQKLTERLDSKIKEEEEKSRRLLKELDNAKASLNDITKESSRNRMQADSAQRALTQANHQIEELQSSSASLRRELDAARKQARVTQDRFDTVNAENRRLSQMIAKHTEEKNELESRIEKLEQEIKGYELNTELLKETCTVLEEQLTDYERLTSNHETRENLLIQDKMKLQKEMESIESKLREAHSTLNEERSLRLAAERNVERLESETSDIESERNGLIAQRDQYKKLVQELSGQVEELTTKCGDLECDLSEVKRALELTKAETRVVKEESSQHLTRVHELKEANFVLMNDLQSSIDQGQELRMRISELESILEEMRQFYQEREVKAESTMQQQTKLIDYLQFKLEECSKKKKTVCDKILGTKQKENVPPSGTGMPVGYRELENQLAKERAKVKTLTDQLLALKAVHASTSAPSSPAVPDVRNTNYNTEQSASSLYRRLSPQRPGHMPHRFEVGLPMRAGKCSACLDSIQFGKRAAICSECQVMTHLKCAVTVPTTCGLPGGYNKEFGKSWRNSDENLSSLSGSVQTLTIDQPDKPETDVCSAPNKNDKASMESWVKIPERSRTCWERKYLRLEGTCLCTYEHQPSPGMVPINRLDLIEKDGFSVVDTVYQPDVIGTAKSDLPFIFRVESNSSTTCWPTSRLDIMALSQADKKNWLKALKSVTSQNQLSNVHKNKKYQTILRLEKHQLDLNCAVNLTEENVLLLGAEEGLFSYCGGKSRTLTAIRGVKRVHQLTLHPHLGIALMIAGENRQLVSCSLRQLKSNAVAAECSRPAINTKAVLNSTDSCHLYQLQKEMLCAATASHVILLKWYTEEDSGEFIGIRELETSEPCSCAIFAQNVLIVGCNKFFQIDLKNYCIDEFPEEDDSSVKAALSGVAKLGIFPVCVLNVSLVPGKVELLLCYNEFGMFVNESGQRTRSIDPTWNHLPFAFAFRKPYLFIIHFSSVEIVKLDQDAYITTTNPERILIELSSPRYLGLAGSKGIYVATVNSFLELLKIEGPSNISQSNGSLTSLDTMDQDDDSSSEFSFTSSLMEALDGQGKKVHFVGVSKY
ncbi:Citron rho-interacting kinase [Anthophora plagiata]